MSDKTREAPTDEQILHLWDIYVGYESAAPSAKEMPLTSADKLAFARAVLAANAEEVKRLREALEKTTQALGDLSFECFAVFGTCAPSTETYNRTFGVLEKARDALQGDKQGSDHG